MPAYSSIICEAELVCSGARAPASNKHNHENFSRDHCIGTGTGQVLACFILKKTLCLADFISSTNRMQIIIRGSKRKKRSPK